MLRRRSDPRELASVLDRLERLRAGPTPASTPAPWSPNVGTPAAARPAGVGAKVVQVWRAHAFDPGRRGLAVLGVLAVVAALGGAWYFVTARPTTVGSAAAHEVAATPQQGSATSLPSSSALSGWPTVPGSSPTTLSSDLPIVVDVVGKVVAPGVVELPPGSRIRDAVQAAGGALPGTDLTALDLASRLSDGQEIFVGIAPPSGPAAQAAGGVIDGAGAATGGTGSASGGKGSAAGGSSSGIVDVNTATLADLETLPGVGPVLAQHIVGWRTQHGRFTAITQLQQVSGIGPSKYADLAARVRI